MIATALPWVVAAALVTPMSAQAQVKAMVRLDEHSTWTKGIQPISRESYWHGVECGKQGGAQPACVFWDADLCKNGDFTLLVERYGAYGSSLFINEIINGIDHIEAVTDIWFLIGKDEAICQFGQK